MARFSRMSSALRAEYLITPEAYLAGERVSGEKHEYLAGVVHAMAGTTVNHDRIAVNMLIALGNQLRGKLCEVFSSDVKVRIDRDAASFFYYPDLVVDCSRTPGASLYANEPKAIFEVLSPDTERIDRGEKLRNYQSIPSLEAYIMVDQFHVAVSVYRRTTDGWTFELLTEPTDELQLTGLDCALELEAIYERTGVRV